MTIARRLVLVREADPEKRRQGREQDQGRVEQDEPRLGDQPVLEQDKERAEQGRRGAEVQRAQGQIREGDERESEGRGQQPHRDVGDVGGSVLGADVFKVELAAFETGEPGDEGDEEFGERGVHVHEEARLDVPARAGGIVWGAACQSFLWSCVSAGTMD